MIVVFSSEISCTSDSIVVNKDELITPIECLDDSSVHLPLSIYNLPYGLQFDGKTISGKIIDSVVHHIMIVFNNETSYQIQVNSIY